MYLALVLLLQNNYFVPSHVKAGASVGATVGTKNQYDPINMEVKT